MTADDKRLGFRHDPDRVRAVVEALSELVADGERTYFRTRDLDLDGSNAALGAVVALIADRPDDVSTTYDIEVDIGVERHGKQPKGTVWVVRPR